MKHQMIKILFLSILFILIFIPIRNLSKGYFDITESDQLARKNQVLSMSWQKLNGPYGGQGYTIRFDKNNPNKIIVTDAFAGIHISYDRGITWEESNSGIDARSGKSSDAITVFVTTIDPNDTNKIWCGVRNLKGVFFSNDGGMTWQRKDNGLPDGENVEMRGLAVKPGDSNTVFVAGDLEEIGSFMGAFQRTEGIVYRTTDGGENWVQVLMGGNLFKDIIIDPNNPDTVYVASGIFDRHELTKTEGIYKSTDGGNTWTQVNKGVRNLYVGSLKFDPTDPNILWGTTGMLQQFADDLENTEGGIIISKDGGMNWTEIKRGRKEGGTQVYSALGISPSNPNVIYASGFGIFVRSKDGGMSWTETGFGPLGSNAGHAIDIAVDPNNENVLYVDSYVGGVFKSTDGGETWTSNAFGYSGAQTNYVAITPDSKNVFATSRTGVFLSRDKGVNWTAVGLGDIGQDELHAIAPHPTDPDKVLVGDSGNGLGTIFLSTDGGMIWTSVFMLNKDYNYLPGATDQSGTVVYTRIEWAKSNPSVAYASCVKQALFREGVNSIGWGTFKSTDGGMTWVNKQNGIPGFKNTWSLAIDPKNENVVYIATDDSGILKTIDGGETWTQINNGLGDEKSFHSVVVSPLDSQILLSGTNHGTIFKSVDGGSNWKIVFPDFKPLDNITGIVFNPVIPGQVFASADVTGFYVSNDSAESWEQWNDGLSMREVTSLAASPDGSAVYVSTNGGGTFRLALTSNDLTLAKEQTEIPSNAGIDASNNTDFGMSSTTSSSSSSSSTGGTSSGFTDGIVTEFSLSISGPALEGIPVFKNKSSKSQLNINFDQSLFNESALGSQIKITSDLPKAALAIRPDRFVLVGQDSTQVITLAIKPFKKLQKMKEIKKLFPEGPPENIILHIKQIIQSEVLSKDIEIPVLADN